MPSPGRSSEHRSTHTRSPIPTGVTLRHHKRGVRAVHGRGAGRKRHLCVLFVMHPALKAVHQVLRLQSMWGKETAYQS